VLQLPSHQIENSLGSLCKNSNQITFYRWANYGVES